MTTKDAKPRIRLLVSVRNAAEAVDAVEGGADIIDIKEPSRGALGRADRQVIASIIEAVGGKCPVSVAMGELTEWRGDAQMIDGLAYGKIGLAGMSPESDWRERLKHVFGMTGLPAVGVAYADLVSDQLSARNSRGVAAHPALNDVVTWAIENRAAGLLLDTTVKDGRNLFDFLEEATIRRVQLRARAAGLFVALAGSLRDEALIKALSLEPDIIAVRGAACDRGARTQAVDRERVRAMASLIGAHPEPAAV